MEETCSRQPSQGFNPHCWWTQDFRIIQTNLREIDVLQESREIARSVREFGANAIISSIGGIVAFYPTNLELHIRSPYLRGDFVGEMIAASRAEGLAYIGRFDNGGRLRQWLGTAARSRRQSIDRPRRRR